MDEFTKLIQSYKENQSQVDPMYAGVDLSWVELDEPLDTMPYQTPSYGIPAAPVSSKDVDQMKSILEKFTSVGESTATTIADQATRSSYLSEAIDTHRTEDSVIFGNKYKIEIIAEDKKRFNVVDTKGNTIASDLYLYEAAYAIVKYLNSGVPALSPAIRKIIVLEERYYSNRADAARFKKRYQKANTLRESRDADIFAARYQSAKENALDAKRQIQTILNSI